KAGHIALNVTAGYTAAVLGEQAIGFREDARHGTARVVPFIDHLLEDARLGMLWKKTSSKHFDALARDLLHDRRIVHEPPATERHQIIELSRVDAEFVLVLPAKNTHQEAVVREFAAQILQTFQVCSTQSVARQAQ